MLFQHGVLHHWLNTSIEASVSQNPGIQIHKAGKLLVFSEQAHLYRRRRWSSLARLNSNMLDIHCFVVQVRSARCIYITLS